MSRMSIRSDKREASFKLEHGYRGNSRKLSNKFFDDFRFELRKVKSVEKHASEDFCYKIVY